MHIKNIGGSIGRSGSRRVNSSRNAAISLLISLLMMLFSFLSRTVFIHRLSLEYLGLGGLFSNILSFLSLAELGIGGAMNYALFAPLKTGDREKVKSLMAVYRRLYTAVFFVILILGTALLFLLPLLMKEMPESIPPGSIRLYFMMHVFASAASYLFAYKRALIICDQREYISTLSAGAFRLVIVCLQIAILTAGGTYFIYLAVGIAGTLAENLFITRVANRLYPFLRDREIERLDKQEMLTLRKNIIAVFFHRVGGIVVFASDNLIMSKFLGLLIVGIYSNYTVIFSSIHSILSKMMTAAAASVGNLMADRDDEHTETVFYHMLFINAWLYGFTAVCLYCLLQPFICLWLGEKFLLPRLTVALAVISYYIGGVRYTLLIFKDGAGIFRQDRFKPLVEGVVNILVSIPLAIWYGVTGILAGTVFSTLTVAFWYEAYTFFRFRYRKNPLRYLGVQAEYFLLNTVLAAVTFALCERIDPAGGFCGFVLRMLLCAAVPNLFYLVLFRKSGHMYYILAFARVEMVKIRQYVNRKRR